MYHQIAANKRNTIFLIIGFIVFITFLGGIFAYYTGDIYIAVWTLIISTFYALIQYFSAAKLTIAMTGAQKINKIDNPRLYNIVENLCITTGLPMPEIYIVNDPAPNAFATGRNPEHSLVAATTGLLDIMDDNELRAVMAHEISHIKNYDIRVSLIVFGLTCVIGYLADIGLRIALRNGNREKDNGPIALIFLLVSAILAPLVATIAQLAVSREREYLADMSAAHITRYPEGMISALKKLRDHAQPMRTQSSAADSMYISSTKKKGGLNLFDTHPSLDKRIERLENAKTTF